MNLKVVTNAINTLLRPLRIQVSSVPSPSYVPPDMDEAFRTIFEKVLPYTMTPVEGLHALYKAVSYATQHGIAGDIVECGVWRGGASMLSAFTLLAYGDTSRSLYLYDTFTGMTEPTERDREIASRRSVRSKWMKSRMEGFNAWCYAPVEEVRSNLLTTRYPPELLHLVQGPVEKTIPTTLPDSIAVLRLDTDWYESTYHELVHLFPRLSSGGVLIVDDYGQWAGAREAVDRYFGERACPILLVRLPRSGCIAVKR